MSKILTVCLFLVTFWIFIGDGAALTGHVMEFSGNGSVRVRRGSSDGKKRKAIASGVAWALCDQWEVHLEENCITAPIKKDTPGNDVKCGWYDWTRCTASSCKPFKLDKC